MQNKFALAYVSGTIMNINKRDLKKQRTQILKFYHFRSAKNTPRDTHTTRKSLFLQRDTRNAFLKIMFLQFFPKILIVPKKSSAHKTTFSQAEISNESKGVPFDRTKTWKRDALS